jgi:hypothetical protein
MAVKTSIQTGISISLGGFGAPTIAYGIGVPNASKATGASTSAAGTPVVGSQYIRTDGTVSARVYYFYSGAWVAAASP